MFNNTLKSVDNGNKTGVVEGSNWSRTTSTNYSQLWQSAAFVAACLKDSIANNKVTHVTKIDMKAMIKVQN